MKPCVVLATTPAESRDVMSSPAVVLPELASVGEIIHVLSREQGKSWTGERGRIRLELIEKYCPPPDDDVLFFVCGPPPMYEDLCGPRGVKEITGVLKKLGYRDEQVVKF